jgi:polysaccharide export outer membrane protein
VNAAGYITLPMAGSIKAAGLSVDELEAEITRRLKTYYKMPEVSVTRTEFRSQPVSVLGEVERPGTHELKGRKTLAEILSLAGGLKEDAGSNAKITRRIEWGRIPLPNASDDPTGRFSIADVSLRDLTEAVNPANNVLIMPEDVISVSKADLVYVIGDVVKAGGIVLNGKQPVTVLQALSLADGPSKTAKSTEAKILRVNPSSAKRAEIPVNLKALLAGKIDDVAMQPNDILFVPAGNRAVTARLLESALQVGTGVAILSIRP